MNLSRCLSFNKTKIYPKLAAVVGSIVVYILIFLGAYPSIGGALSPLALLPAMLAGWFLGMLAGLLTAILMDLINLFLFSSLTVPVFNKELVQTIPAFITVLLVGTMTGWLRSLFDQIKQQSQKLADEHAVLAREIAGRKQVEQVLQESERRYRRIFENVQDVYYELAVDGTILDISPSIETLSKYSGEELIGKSAYDIYFRPEQRDEAVEALQRTGVVNDFEVLLKDKDGQPVFCSFTAKLLRDKNGVPYRTIGTLRDITERKRTEEALRQGHDELERRVQERTIELSEEISERKRVEEALRASEERLTLALQGANDGLWDWDIANNTLYWSPRLKELLGYADDELEVDFDTFDSMLHPDDKAPVAAAIEAHLQDRVPYDVEQRTQTKSGQYRWFRDRGQAIWDEAGRPLRMVGFSTDITEWKQAETQIKAALKEKEILLQEIHHRVKNNLQVISSLLNLQAEYINDQQVLHILQDSQNRVRSMALIHEKLYQSSDLARIDIAEYIQNLVAYLIRSYRVDTGKITLNIKTHNIFLGVDTAVPCGLILNELISNSLKYAFPNGKIGKIYIGLSVDGDGQLTLIVGDNGIGLSTDIDFQHTTSLGLQLVCTLVGQLDGIIKLDSTHGTEFEITFAIP